MKIVTVLGQVNYFYFSYVSYAQLYCLNLKALYFGNAADPLLLFLLLVLVK